MSHESNILEADQKLNRLLEADLRDLVKKHENLYTPSDLMTILLRISQPDVSAAQISIIMNVVSLITVYEDIKKFQIARVGEDKFDILYFV